MGWLLWFHGLGLAIPVIAFTCLMAVNLLSDITFGRGTYGDYGLPKLLGCWLAAWAVHYARPYLGHANEHGAPATPWEARWLFIRARYWPGILFALGIVMMFM